MLRLRRKRRKSGRELRNRWNPLLAWIPLKPTWLARSLILHRHLLLLLKLWRLLLLKLLLLELLARKPGLLIRHISRRLRGNSIQSLLLLPRISSLLRLHLLLLLLLRLPDWLDPRPEGSRIVHCRGLSFNKLELFLQMKCE